MTNSAPAFRTYSGDDGPTLAALGVLAFALADISHEALGHGLATFAVGGKAVLLTTCYFTSNGRYSRWIPASGGLMNLAVGLASLGALRLLVRSGPHLRCFLMLAAAFNLFFAFGYPAYSGIALFGDWAAVISGLQPHWLWRILLVVITVVGYYTSMRLLAGPLASFAEVLGVPSDKSTNRARLKRVTHIPFVAAILLAYLAGAGNPNGWRTMLTAGLPAAAAAFGLTQMAHFVSSVRAETSPQASLRRSPPWILAAILVLLFFVGVLGPGVRFS